MVVLDPVNNWPITTWLLIIDFDFDSMFLKGNFGIILYSNISFFIWINWINMSLKLPLLWKKNLLILIYPNEGTCLTELHVTCGRKRVMIFQFYTWTINRSKGRFIIWHVVIIFVRLLYKDITQFNILSKN